MGDFQHSIDVRRPPEEVFAYLSDAEHLPEWVSGLQQAKRAGGEEVDVVAVGGGEQHEDRAWMHADADARSVRWGADRVADYHGELFVTGIGDEDSRVTVTLHTPGTDDPAVQQDLEQTLADLERRLDGSTTG